ncbi:TMV resistance protein N-like [Eucalyptus grandis]|uniref:TMV resistance protein N-like n=1 Tax=Eucalyptus grandis TaxID=71139 RepID=UPI00192E92D0|nr:TMV resistance protein N-like [Eucalyptus grandis]
MMRKLGVVYRDGRANRVCGGDVRVVGICGLRGVGKTTLAKVVYNKMRSLFQECSFLEDMKAEEVKSLQERLIATLQKRRREPLDSCSAGIKNMENSFSDMKVLIVLDDVRDDQQIKRLVGKLTWFGPGSRIIVTTDNEKVLNGYDEAVEIYDVQPMEPHHALQLFRRYAFLGEAPQDYEYDSLSIDIVKAIGGLPMAIIHQASNLSKKRNDKGTWRYTSDHLKNRLPEDISPCFMDSYESLHSHLQRMFLDIACFFIDKDERIPPYMWKACDHYSPLGMDSLRKLHWLEKGENNELRMHNLIRDFGRDIIKRKVNHKRCRFWNHSDALEILDNPKGSESVEGIGLTVEEGHVDSFKCEGFREMPNLRYLRLDRANIQGETKNLPPNLRWLDWRDCRSIPELHDTHLKNLVILDLSRSLVPQDPKIWSRIMEVWPTFTF